MLQGRILLHRFLIWPVEEEEEEAAIGQKAKSESVVDRDASEILLLWLEIRTSAVWKEAAFSATEFFSDSGKF